MVVLGATLAALAAAAASAVAPSFRLALVGSLSGASTRPLTGRQPRPGRLEPRALRPRPSREPVLDEVAPPAQPATPPEPGTFEIEWFRGYVKSRFFVVLDEGGEERLVESPWFAWRKPESPPPMPDFVAARDALLAKLEREGWHECGRGEAWYSRRVSVGALS